MTGLGYFKNPSFPMPDNPYESDELLQQYLLFHYGTLEDQFPYPFGGADAFGFPQRCVSEGIDVARLPENARALDLGCAVGRSTFELARHCSKVIGIDFSRTFIDAAIRVKEHGKLQVTRVDEGSNTTVLSLSVEDTIDRNRVSFEQGDAQCLRDDLGEFDVLIACNLICRLPDPMRLLERLPELVKPGGQLLITTPYTWLEEYTPPSRWLDTGESTSFEGLQKALEPTFALEKKWDMPFLIREHARKFQYSIAQGSRWIRK